MLQIKKNQYLFYVNLWYENLVNKHIELPTYLLPIRKIIHQIKKQNHFQEYININKKNHINYNKHKLLNKNFLSYKTLIISLHIYIYIYHNIQLEKNLTIIKLKNFIQLSNFEKYTFTYLYYCSKNT